MISKREDNDKALFLLFKAIALDPSYTLGKALAAFATVLRKSQHWSTPDEEAAGIRLAEEALSSHGDHPTALACAAHALAYLGRRYDPALRAMDQAPRLRAELLACSDLECLGSSILRRWRGRPQIIRALHAADPPA